MAIPAVLTIGPVDPLGVDGIVADLRALAGSRVHGAAVATSVATSFAVPRADGDRDGTEGAGEPLPAALVRDQILRAFAGLDIAAIKLGAPGSAALAGMIAETLAGCPAVPLVLDPSLATRAGAASEDGRGDAHDDALVAACRTQLLPRATVALANLAEAALLTGSAPAGTLGEMLRQGEALVALGCAHAVLSGGHGGAATSTDILVTRGEAPLQMDAERLDRAGLGGLSATFAAAIAANIARGDAPVAAIQYAKLFVTSAIANAGLYAPEGQLRPINAFHRMWLSPTSPPDPEPE